MSSSYRKLAKCIFITLEPLAEIRNFWIFFGQQRNNYGKEAAPHSIMQLIDLNKNLVATRRQLYEEIITDLV
jgi:hypothetical protein